MEALFTEFLKSSPGLALALIIFIVLLKYISSKDALMQTQFDRVETIHNKTMETIDRNTLAFGTITEAMRKCSEKRV